jgi:uncharacterized protein (TIGR03663 family)
MYSDKTTTKGLPVVSSRSGANDVGLLIPLALIALAALVARLAALDRWPLLTSEANTALTAWQAVMGPRSATLPYVPLLYDVQLLATALLRPTDGSLRLLSALAGATLVFLPWFARELLGKRGALAAAVLLAISPSWLFFSRLADGAILASCATAGALLGLYRYLVEGRRRALAWAAAATALGMLSGPAILTPVVVALLFGLGWLLVGRRGLPVGSAVQERARTLGRDLVTPAIGLPAVALLVGLGTAALTNLRGLGMAVDLQWRWFAELAPGASGLPWFHLLRSLGLYEYLTVALGLVGLVWGLLKRERLTWAMGAWLLLALLLGTLLGHRQPSWLLDVLLPLVVLAARGAQRLWDALRQEVDWRDGVALWLAFVLAWFTFVSLASYLQTGQERFVTQSRIGLGLLILAWAGYWFWAQRDAALRLAVGLLVIVMIIFTVRAATAVAYQTGRDAREPLVVAPTSTEVQDLAAFVAGYASRTAGDPHLLDVAYERTLDPLVGWYLREQTHLVTEGLVDVNPTHAALVALARADEQFPVGYVGQHFRLVESWPAQELTTRERLRWFFFRDPVGRLQNETVRVWVRLEP